MKNTPSFSLRNTVFVLAALGSSGVLATPSPISILNSIPAPYVADDQTSLELGLKFTSDVSGYVTGVRFFKDPRNAGVHTGSLWTSTGTLLATVTFANETASGWQVASFSPPAAIAANTTYVISYHTDGSYYCADLDSFASSGIDSGVLHALSGPSSGGNGVYKLGASGFPSSSFRDANYWVDVVFSSTATNVLGNAQPASIAQSTQSVELGLKFTSDVEGFVTGVRFYKGAGNTGTHSGSLWSSAGTLLAATTFRDETATGWQVATFSAPVAIAANTTYVVSYHTDTDHQESNLNYFASSGANNGVLHAPSSPSSGGNGVFAMGASSFPSSVYQDSNYWVDVVFASTATNDPFAGPARAFPGAEGGGANSVGGRGGVVYLVTNLNDSGAGSLRACIEATGPRICVFRTGGTIWLTSTLAVADPYITIAGQTAPGGGIQLAGPSGLQAAGNPSLQVSTHDVVIQYLRVRRGHNAGEECEVLWTCGASTEIISNNASHDPYNIVLDHMSNEWSNYDGMIILGSSSSAPTTPPRAVTVSRSIIGEALGGAGQVVGANFSGYSLQGPAALDNMVDIDLSHNLFAGASHRMPMMAVKSGRLVNNFVYAWTYYPMRNKGLRDFIGNFFKLRNGQALPSHEIQAWDTNDGNYTSHQPSFYLAGNAGPSDPTGTANWNNMTALTVDERLGEAACPMPPCLPTAYQRGSQIPTPAGYIAITAEPFAEISSASGSILNTPRAAPYDSAGASRKLGCNGAWLDALDPVDTRIINAVANGTNLYGSYTYDSPSESQSPQSQTHLGGWPALAAGSPCADANGNGLPDVWESYWAGRFSLGSVLDANAKSFGDDYTNIEHYLSGLSPSP